MTNGIDYRNLNREKLTAYFEAGDKRTQKFGFELEHALLHEDGSAARYSERGGVRDVLELLSAGYDEKTLEGGELIGMQRAGEAISIEPAGQLEVSIGPCSTVREIEATYRSFRERLDPILAEFGLVAPLLGYNPASKACDLELVPKYRYECMTKFLGAQAYEGICMMRGTASLQVSIDFENEADAMRKLRIAEGIAPILALICDNSPIYEGAARRFNMVRTAVWAGMNQDRVGTVPGSLDEGFTFADYADYIMTREAILVPDMDAEHGWRYVADTTFDEVYAKREMSEREIEHALSMVWPDARLKNFVEIRPADAMPIEYCLSYTALVRALFYEGNLGKLAEIVGGVSEDDVRDAKIQLMERGYDAVVYGRPVADLADCLFALAQESATQEGRAYLEPLFELVKARTTLAERYLLGHATRLPDPNGSGNLGA